MRVSVSIVLWCVLHSPCLANDPYSVEYRTTADWGSGFNGQITMRNGSSQPLRAWVLEFDFTRSIDSIWDARIEKRSGSHYVIRSAGWNDVIEPGKALLFGFGGSPGNVDRAPENVRITSAADPPSSGAPAPPRISVTIRENSRSADGFSATLTLSNTGGAELGDWTLRFAMDASITSMWSGAFRKEANLYVVTPLADTRSVPPGGVAWLGFQASGRLTASSASSCRIDETDCTLTVIPMAAPPASSLPISIDGQDHSGPATQLSLMAGDSRFGLRGPSTSASFRVMSTNPSVVTATVQGETLRLTALAPGRAGIRIDETSSGASRWVGIRVRNPDGTVPGMPGTVALGSVSEDSPAHLNFWRGAEPGPRNRRVDIRYIYLNGGPFNGWDTWGNSPGSRAVNYIRNSRMLGMIPMFVFYNIPDASESYELDLAHAQSRPYTTAYFRNLKMFLDIVQRESPDDLVGVILEPDFLGYLAQNANRPASEIPAATRGAYDAAVLGDTDPQFPETIRGLVEAINFTIRKYTPQAYFGWQMNLWASKAGGFTTPIPARGIIHKTDGMDIEEGRQAIYGEAVAITRYYLDAGVASHGAQFLSIDKYGLDAVGLEQHAATDPGGSIWFWNSDHWHNYLLFVRAIHETAGMPIVLWQLPVGRINTTMESNPYSPHGRFEDLPNTVQRYEDSAAPFFFGDTLTSVGDRRDYFATNRTGDPGMSVSGDAVTWTAHVADAERAGVVAILFGAGVGASTSSVGDPPTDGFWWITKAQNYLRQPVPLRRR
jgi:hypothetical protein